MKIIWNSVHFTVFLCLFSAGKTADLPQEALTGLVILQAVAKKMALSKKTLSLYVPQHLLAAHSG